MADLPRTFRRSLGLILAGLVAATPTAHALLNFDGTRNQLFVFGNASFAYNSNIFARAGGSGDYSLSLQVGAELKRQAGLITVDGTAKMDYARYQSFPENNYANPSLGLVFTKGTGRTTGSFSISAYRETRSDSAVNMRTTAWNLPITLAVRYPINEKFHLASTTDYLRRKYEDNDALVDYADISESVDFYYTHSSKLDLLAGYRFRLSEASTYGHAQDHWFNVGASGGLLAKLSGTIRIGYQLRFQDFGNPDHYDHFNFSAGLNWPVLRKLALALNGDRDFGTIATGESVDTLSATLSAIYTYSRKLQFNVGLTGGISDFLGESQNNRRDSFVGWNAGFNYRMNEHFQFGAVYTYYNNWSTLPTGDYESQGISVNVSSRY